MAQTYSFRITAEGLNQFRMDMEALAKTSDLASMAWERLRTAAPQLASAMDRAQAATDRATTQLSRQAQAASQAAQTHARFGQVVAAAGPQLQDLVIQLQMGTNAFQAIAQQGSQFLGMFGAGGAMAGVALAIGAVAAQLVGLAGASRDLDDVLKDQDATYRRLTDAAKARVEGLKSEAEAVEALRMGYLAMGEAGARAEAIVRQRQIEALNKAGDELLNKIGGGLTGRLADLERQMPAFDIMGAATGFTTGSGAALARDIGQAVEAFRQLRDVSGLTVEGLRAYIVALDDAMRAGGGASAEIRRLRDAAADALPQVASLEAAYRQNAVQAAALRLAAGESAEAIIASANAAEGSSTLFGKLTVEIVRAAEALNKLRQQAVDNPLAAINAEIVQAEAQLHALNTGGLAAYERVKTAQEQQVEITRRATELQEQFAKALVESGVAADEAAKRAEEMGPAFVTAATRAVDANSRLAQRLEQVRDAAKEAKQAEERISRDAQSLQSAWDKWWDDAEKRAEQRADREEEKRIEAAQRAIEQEEQRRQQSFDRTVERYSSMLSRGTVDAIFDGTRKGQSFFERLADVFGNSLRVAFASALDVNLFRPAIAGLLNSFGFDGGSGGGVGVGLDGRASIGSGVAGTGGTGLLTYAGQAGSLYSMGNRFGLFGDSGGLMGWMFGPSNLPGGSYNLVGGIGNALTGGWANTGFSGVDAFLNTPLYMSGSGASVPALAGYGAGIEQGMGAAALYNPSQAPGLTLGGALGGAASLAGGAYGIYSGIQKGGIGGGFQAAGGALSAGLGAATMASLSVPVYGWIAAAVLSIIGAILPGMKPSNKTGSALYDITNDALVSIYGQTGSKYSQENRDAAVDMVNSIASLVRQVEQLIGGFQLRGGIVVDVGNRDGIALAFNNREVGRYQRSEEGAQALTADALREMLYFVRNELPRSLQSALGGINFGDLNDALTKLAQYSEATNGGRPSEAQNAANIDYGNWNQAMADLQWIRDVYDPLVKAREAGNKYQEQLNAIAEKWDAEIQHATRLGLAIDLMTEARDKEIQALQDQRQKLFEDWNKNLVEREKALGGDFTRDPLQQQLDMFDQAAKAELEQAKQTLKDWGASAEDTAAWINRIERIQGAERVKIVEDWNRQLTATLQDFDINLAQRRAEAGLGDPTAAKLAAYDVAAAREIENTRIQLQQLGLSAEEVSRRLADLADVQAAERDAIIRQANQQAYESAQQEFAAAQQAYVNAIDQQISALNESTAAHRQAAQTLRAAADSITEFNKSLLTGPQSPLTLEQQLAQLRGEFADAQRRASTGTPEERAAAAQDAQRLAQQLLDVSGRYYGTASAAYQQTFEATRSSLDKIGTNLNKAASAEERAIKAADAQLTELQKIREQALALGQQQVQSLEALRATMEAAFVKMNATGERAGQTASGATANAAMNFVVGGDVAFIDQASRDRWQSMAAAGVTGDDLMRAIATDLVEWGWRSKVRPDLLARYGLRDGGWVGNGLWNVDSVLARYAGGGAIALAGGEYVVNAVQAARYSDVLPRINAGTFANDNGAVLAELRALRSEVAELRAVRAELVELRRTTAQGAMHVAGKIEDGNAIARENTTSARLARAS